MCLSSECIRSVVVFANTCRWRSFYTLIQKTHFKTGNVHKLEAAVKVYAGLTEIAIIRQEVMMKLAGMLLHPFPNVSIRKSVKAVS